MIQYNYMKKLLEGKGLESTCPMCNVEITMDDIKLVGEGGVAALKVVAKEEDKDKKRDIATPMAADWLIEWEYNRPDILEESLRLRNSN